MSAAETIRASVEALPQPLQVPWRSEGCFVATAPHMANVCETWEDKRAPVSAHIALLASPHVAAALADLLDALRHTEGVLQDVDVWNAYEALEAAICGSGT